MQDLLKVVLLATTIVIGVATTTAIGHSTYPNFDRGIVLSQQESCVFGDPR